MYLIDEPAFQNLSKFNRSERVYQLKIVSNLRVTKLIFRALESALKDLTLLTFSLLCHFLKVLTKNFRFFFGEPSPSKLENL